MLRTLSSPSVHPHHSQSPLARCYSPEIHYEKSNAIFAANGSRGAKRMVDASTQYSPPTQPQPPQTQTAQVNNHDDISRSVKQPHTGGRMELSRSSQNLSIASDPERKPASGSEGGSSRAKRSADETEIQDRASVTDGLADNTAPHENIDGASKRLRPKTPPVKRMPVMYETCDPRDLVVLISAMLMELIRYNDPIPLRNGHLTRFHSRAPPGISVLDYLQRLTTHATLSPPILLSMVYYIDRLCALYPAFTISSLTVHRFLITSATVATKGLSDSFWTNKTYAKVGGVSMKELALLELEFLSRVDWRIVPSPEVLVDYYRSLIERSDGYELEDSHDHGG